MQRLAEVPGLGVDSAQQIIAEVGATAATFPSPKHLASWMGACPGNEESAGVNYSHRCPKGNRQMRRVLNQAANAAVKAKGTIFAVVYRRLVPRLGHAQAIGAITHRLCRLIWKILHERVRYEERGPAVSAEAKKVRARKMIRELRSLGYRVEPIPLRRPTRHDRERFSTLVNLGLRPAKAMKIGASEWRRGSGEIEVSQWSRRSRATVWSGACVIDRIIGRRAGHGRRRQLATLTDTTRHALRSPKERPMPYRIAGIDVHKKMLAVVSGRRRGRRRFPLRAPEGRDHAGRSARLGRLAGRARRRGSRDGVDRAVLAAGVGSAGTALAPPTPGARRGAARSRARCISPKRNRIAGPGGRKKDFPDAERLVKRLVAQELTLSFVPDTEQRLWRTVMRRRYQITRNRVQLHNRLEALLEEAHIKVSSLVSDLLGISARRMLQALADGETDPAALAALAAPRLRATPAQLCDAFQACPTLHPVYRRLLKLTLEELRVIEDHLGQLDQQMADLLAAHHDAVQRLAEVPGLGVDSAQQIIAEVGATAATFPSPKHLASWMGACPGNEESAGVNYSHRCPKGNRQMRRVLNQAANAAVKAKGTIFAVVYRRLVPRLGHAQAIGAITHRLCRLIWKILHERVRYEERGPAVSVEAKKVRARKMIRELRGLGYRVELISPAPSSSPA